MILLATRDHGWMRQCDAVLLAEGVESHWMAAEDGFTALLDVATSDSEHVTALLSQQLGEALHRSRIVVPPASTTPLWLQPPFALALCSAAALVLFFWVTGSFAGRSDWFARGALTASTTQTGQWWRMITAATLHADVEHILGNAIFLVVLGWAVAERVGGGLMLLAWLVTAVGGFAVSLLTADAGVTVGASGGLFGLLGVAGAQAVRAGVVELNQRRRWLRALGAALMLLAFTAFSRDANIHAHVGGFCAGLLLGALLPRGCRWPCQLAAALAVAGVLLAAWLAATTSW